MNLIQKTLQTAKDISTQVATSAKNISVTAYSATKDQAAIHDTECQIHDLENLLEKKYAALGKSYWRNIQTANASDADNQEIMQEISWLQQEIGNLKEKYETAQEAERKRREQNAYERAKAEYETAVKKLDQGRVMGILTEEEYIKKYERCQKKLNAFTDIYKLDQQLKLGIIDVNEYNKMIQELLA